MKKIACIAVLLLWIAPFAFSYSLILKNGKAVEGTLIREDDETFSIKDKDGVTLNFKKNIVDLEKTAVANRPSEERPPIVKEADKPVEAKSPAKPKKPARVYSSTDLYRLRNEYPMESGAGVQYEEGKPETAPKGRSGEEWQEITQSLLAQIKSAEQAYQLLSAKCKEFQGAAIQTHMASHLKAKKRILFKQKSRPARTLKMQKQQSMLHARSMQALSNRQSRKTSFPVTSQRNSSLAQRRQRRER